MRNKIIIIFFIIVFLIALVFLVLKKTNKIEVETEVEELVPAEEISDEQVRSTIVTLYFKDKNSDELLPEARSIDVKELMEEPYLVILNMLIEGPMNNNFEGCIPEGTELINAYLDDDLLIVDFSDKFLEIENNDVEEQKFVIDSILRTMVELREVNGIKILIEGESNVILGNSNINLSDEFRLNNVD